MTSSCEIIYLKPPTPTLTASHGGNSFTGKLHNLCSSSFAQSHVRKDFYSIVACMPRGLFGWNVCTQANFITDLLTNKLKSFNFGILFLDCVETDHERRLFSLICRIAVLVHATTETDMAILRYTIF